MATNVNLGLMKSEKRQKMNPLGIVTAVSESLKALILVVESYCFWWHLGIVYQIPAQFWCPIGSPIRVVQKNIV